MKLPEPIKFTTVPEVARLFGVSRMTVYRQISAGELRAIRVGRQFRIPIAAVREYVQAHDTDGAA